MQPIKLRMQRRPGSILNSDSLLYPSRAFSHDIRAWALRRSADPYASWHRMIGGSHVNSCLVGQVSDPGVCRPPSDRAYHRIERWLCVTRGKTIPQTT